MYSVFCTCFHHQNFVVVVILHGNQIFGSAVDDVPMSNWNLEMAPGWRCSQHDSLNRPENIANLAPLKMVLALLNRTCILFPASRPVFEQKSREPKNYIGHIQCLLHLLPPSELCSRSDSPYKPNFGSAIDDVPMSN